MGIGKQNQITVISHTFQRPLSPFGTTEALHVAPLQSTALPGPWAPVESTWNAVSRTGSVLPGAVRARGGSAGGRGSPLSPGIFRSCLIPSNLIKSRRANEEMESYPSSAICSFVTSSTALPETGRGASSSCNKKRASSAFGAVMRAAGGCTQTSWSLMHHFACLGKGLPV